MPEQTVKPRPAAQPAQAPPTALRGALRGALPGPGADVVVDTARSQHPWRLEKSIWAGRPATAASGTYWDDHGVVERAVLTDWRSCLAESKLLDHLIKHDTAASGDASAFAPSAVGGARAAFSQAIGEVLVSHGRLILSAFDYYASLGPSSDLFHIQSLGYLAWLEECDLILPGSKAADLSHLQLIFIAVNQAGAAAEAGRAAAAPRAKATATKVWNHNSRHDLDRAEFLQCLCRVAVARFILSAKPGQPRLLDVSDAIEKLLEQMRCLACAAVRHDANAYRDAQCYTAETDAALRHHEPTLRLLFSKYASADGAMGGKRAESRQLLSSAEWVSLARDLGLIDEDLSMDDARLLFVWSRMRVVDEDLRTSRPKVCQRCGNMPRSRSAEHPCTPRALLRCPRPPL